MDLKQHVSCLQSVGCKKNPVQKLAVSVIGLMECGCEMRAWKWQIDSLSTVWRPPGGYSLPTSSIQTGVTFHHLQVNTVLSLAILVSFTVNNKDWETTHVVNQPHHKCMVSRHSSSPGAKVNYRETSNCPLAEILTTAGVL